MLPARASCRASETSATHARGRTLRRAAEPARGNRVAHVAAPPGVAVFGRRGTRSETRSRRTRRGERPGRGSARLRIGRCRPGGSRTEHELRRIHLRGDTDAGSRPGGRSSPRYLRRERRHRSRESSRYRSDDPFPPRRSLLTSFSYRSRAAPRREPHPDAWARQSPAGRSP